MKTFRRILLGVIVLLVLLMTVGWLLIQHVKNRAVPDYAAPVDLENMVDEVTVIRDSLGIPHVYAKNAEDLYRVVGYLSAQDRLWQMDLMRRITTGQLSEIFGEDMLGADQLFRAFNFSGKSAAVIKSTDPEIIKCLEAYSDGVNQFIRQNKKKLSFEFALLGYKPEEWTAVHTTNLIGYMAWDLASGWASDMAMYKIAQVVDDSLLQEILPGEDVLRTRFVYPDYLDNHPDLALNTTIEEANEVIQRFGIQVFQASNNWAVSGELSETGKPLLANDMHLGVMSPGIWYQMHQVIEGELDVTGVVLPGAPYVICGHNQDIAWGMTNLSVNNLDFYLETINPQDSTQYLLNSEWQDLRIVEEQIKVKGEDEPLTSINKFTHRGPIVSTFKGVKDKTISARWIGTDYSNELRSVHLLNRASNWQEFRNAASTFIAISQNIVYADRQGNIGLQVAGGVPVRKGEHMMVYPGDTTLYDWGENDIVPFEKLPYSYNPESGMVSSANNKTVPDDYPYYIGTWFSLPNRIDRIREMLIEKEQHSVTSFQKMQSDQISAFARRLTPVYLDVLTGNVDGVAEDALEELRNWEYDMDPALSAPLIYEQTYGELIRVIYQDELGEVYPEILNNNIIARHHIYDLAITLESAWCDDISTDQVESFSDNIEKAFNAAIDTLVDWAGDDVMEWSYGDIHTLTIEHPMGGVGVVRKLFDPNLGPYALGGSFHTVAPYSYPIGKNYNVTHSASQRHVYDLSEWDRSKTVIPTGTSGVPASPYYGNQTELYVNFKYHDDPFSREAVETKMKYRTIFK